MPDVLAWHCRPGLSLVNSESLPADRIGPVPGDFACGAKGRIALAAAAELLPAWKQKMVAYAWAWDPLAPLVLFSTDNYH